MENNTLHELVGRTIKSIEWVPYQPLDEMTLRTSPPNDDGDRLKITTTDGYTAIFTGGYREDYTGNSQGEYPTYLSVNVQAPEGFNGFGYFEARLKPSCANWPDMNYKMSFMGKVITVDTETLVFYASSMEEAKSYLDLDEVEYVKWLRR